MVDKIHCAICNSISNRAVEVDDTVLCSSCFDMMLKAGLLFEYDADTDWHYGPMHSRELDMIDAELARRTVLDIVELLK